MGCFSTKPSSRADQDVSEEKSNLANGNYIHYLNEMGLQWQLVLYNLIDHRFITHKINQEYLLPECETIVIGSILYCTGGIAKTKPAQFSREFKQVHFTKKVYIVNNGTSMKTARYKHGFTYINNKHLCVLGGYESENAMTSKCEIFDISLNQWIPGGALNCPRISMACCAFNEKIVYAFGGKFGSPKDPWLIECMDSSRDAKTWNVIRHQGSYIHSDPTKLWCIQSSTKDIILFGSLKTTVFDTTSNKLEEVDEKEDSRYLPDKRIEIKKEGDEVSMVLEENGNVGIYSCASKTWKLQLHIVLGL